MAQPFSEELKQQWKENIVKQRQSKLSIASWCRQSGEEVSHKPGSYFIKEIIRPKYAHSKKEEKGILTADLPDSLLARCRAYLRQLCSVSFSMCLL